MSSSGMLFTQKKSQKYLDQENAITFINSILGPFTGLAEIMITGTFTRTEFGIVFRKDPYLGGIFSDIFKPCIVTTGACFHIDMDLLNKCRSEIQPMDFQKIAEEIIKDFPDADKRFAAEKLKAEPGTIEFDFGDASVNIPKIQGYITQYTDYLKSENKLKP